MTMKHKLFKMPVLLLAVLALFSCEKFTEDEAFGGKEANSTLVVRTRAAQGDAAGTEGEVSYPVNVYVFDDADACVAVQQIASGEDELSLPLPEGTYSVYAISGADAAAYELPVEENATKDAVITLKGGHTHGDLMTANSNVTLAYGEENKLTLAMARKVMMLESVTISNVPAGVTAVAVSVSPLHENIKLDGSYSGDNYEYTATMAREGETDVWKSTGAVYLLEASGSATVKVSFTAGGKIHSYSYSCPQTLEANHKVNISGTYSGDGVTMTGTITGATWDEPIDITFSFDEEGETETVEPGEDGDGQVEDLPVVGQLYKGCYVLREIQPEQGTGKAYTLMSATQLIGSELGGGQVETAINEGIAKLSVPDITGWRLANMDEITYMRENYQKISDNFDLLQKDNKDINLFISSNVSYYCKNGEQKIKTCNLMTSELKLNDPQLSKSEILRAFTTITIQNK